MKKILIADDNRELNKILKDYVNHEGYQAISAYDGRDALDIFKKESPDLMLLDVMMPKLDGFKVCQKIREFSMTPIIMITAKSEDRDKIMGLDMGADDYIVKPFSPKVVMARIRAIFRRIPVDSGTKQVGNIKIDSERRIAEVGGNEIKLTKKEFDLLELFINRKNQVFSREQLLDLLWGMDYEGDFRTVDTHLTRLRSKLERAASVGFQIETVWGVGYKGVENEITN